MVEPWSDHCQTMFKSIHGSTMVKPWFCGVITFLVFIIVKTAAKLAIASWSNHGLWDIESVINRSKTGDRIMVEPWSLGH